MNQVNNEYDNINDTTRQARITIKKPIEADKNSSDKLMATVKSLCLSAARLRVRTNALFDTNVCVTPI